MSGCTSGGCVRAGGATICLGLLTFVLDFANSNRMVWGRSGSNRTPCCKKTGVRHGCWCSTHGWDRVAREMWSCETSFPALIVGQVKLTGGRKGAKSCLFWLVWPLRQVSATIWAARLFLCAGSFCRKPLACCRGWLKVEHTVQVVDGQVASLQIGGKETKWLVVCSF